MNQESKRVIDNRLESARRLERLAEEATDKKPEVVSKKGGWRDIFDNLTYSSGPGDNIYVWG